MKTEHVTIHHSTLDDLTEECRRLAELNAELLAACGTTLVILRNFRAAVQGRGRDAIVPSWVEQEINRLSAAMAKAEAEQ